MKLSDFFQHLTSKTNVGLYTIILFAAVLIYFGKLSGEAEDLLKWIGSSFFLVRSAANVSENLGGKE